ncbi:unnamed protein product [Paramecium primaurelia]|uniref:Actin n=1 Tax=Paramecium primaurelia TaxID=5886 RepID=A0A8S1PAC9_PARPR|nr:unnamed protein product [Paramecium primaurelia]
MNSDEILSVVADIGNLYTRVGFTGDDFPRWSTFTKCTETFQFGDEAMGVGNTQQILDILQPFNSDLYEQLLSKIFEKLYVQPKDYSLLLANNFQSKQDLQKVIEILFESMEIPNFFTIRNAVLATFSAGRSTALILDIGAYSTTASAVHDGYTLLKTQLQAPIGGEQLNEPFKQYIVGEYNQFKKTCQARDIKQSLLTYETIDTNPQYELPDGKFISIQQSQLSEIADKLFYSNENFKGIQHMLMDIINNSTNDIKQLLSSTVISTGGSSNIPGFLNKLQTTLSALAPPMCKVKLVMYPSNQNRYHSVFIGGSILASLSSFQSLWVAKNEYYESGKFSIIERKCPN